MVEMEFRQHSVVHARALADIREHGLHGERGELQPMTHEVLDTFRALGAIQKRNGLKAARRYIISFTKSAQNIKDVYELNRLAFSHPEDVPTIDVIPLFEQLEDLQNSVDVLEEMIKIPEVQARLKPPATSSRSCSATPTPRRTPARPPPRWPCTPLRSASPSGLSRTTST
mgnify:FL=1